MENQNLNLNTPGIRLFVEDPKMAIRRQIKKSVWVISVMVIFTLVVILVIQMEIKKNTQELSQEQNLLSANLAQQSVSDVFQKQAAEILPYKEQIINALPDADNLLAYQTTLEQIAQTSGVQVSISFPQQVVAKPPANIPGQSQTNKTATCLNLTVEIKGPITGINQFILEIEKMAYFVQIYSLNISSTGGAEKDSSASVTLKLFTN